jgi:parallel beta-helix repeat protein
LRLHARTAAVLIAVLIAAGCGGQGRNSAVPTPALAPAVRPPEVPCTLYAATPGDDRGTRNSPAPYRSIQALVDALRPGQTGCVRAGVYREDVSIRRGGRAGAPVTLAGVPGARPILHGSLWIAGGADYVTVRGMSLNGWAHPGVPSPQVNDDHATFYDVDVTNDHAPSSCFVVGGSAETYGVASHTTIAHSRIHDCGRLPRDHLDHGIYLAHSRYATVVDNYIYDNADWGIHLFPDAQGSNVQYNVFNGNGGDVMIAGTGDMASSGNIFANNIFSNTLDDSHLHESSNNYGYHVTSFWGGRVGRDNTVANNCFWSGVAGEVNEVNGGFTAVDNVSADPSYVSSASKDFRLRTSSPCAGDGPRGP